MCSSKQSRYNMALESNLMKDQESIDLFRDYIENIDEEDLNIEMIKPLYNLLDDSTEHHEVMFSVIQGIEYIYMRDIKKGISELLNILVNRLYITMDWAEIILGRILGDEVYKDELITNIKEMKRENKIKLLYVMVCMKEKEVDFIEDVDNILNKVL